MDFWMYFFFILFILSLLGIWYAIVYNKFQALLITIKEINVQMETLLKGEHDLLKRMKEIVQSNLNIKSPLFEDLDRIELEDLATNELDSALNSSINEVYKLKEKYPNLKTSDTFNSIDHDLMDMEEQLVGLRKFYNENVTEYNHLLKKFPTNLVAVTSKQKEKEFYNSI